MKPLIMQFSPICRHFMFLWTKYSPQKPVLKHQVSQPYRTTGKITVLYILIFMFLDSRREDKRFCTEW
jgi:hypothetical protein